MRSWMKNAGRVALVSAGLFAIGSGIASADTTDGRYGTLSGNQVNVPVSAPIDVSGNAAAVAGQATATSDRGAQSMNPGELSGGRTTSGSYGTLSGNQVNSPITAPITRCGNAIAVYGSARGACSTGSAMSPARTCPFAAQPMAAEAAKAPEAAGAAKAPAACAPTSIAPSTSTPGSNSTLTKLVPAANGSPIGAQDLVVLERVTAARQSLG